MRAGTPFALSDNRPSERGAAALLVAILDVEIAGVHEFEVLDVLSAGSAIVDQRVLDCRMGIRGERCFTDRVKKLERLPDGKICHLVKIFRGEDSPVRIHLPLGAFTELLAGTSEFLPIFSAAFRLSGLHCGAAPPDPTSIRPGRALSARLSSGGGPTSGLSADWVAILRRSVLDRSSLTVLFYTDVTRVILGKRTPETDPIVHKAHVYGRGDPPLLTTGMRTVWCQLQPSGALHARAITNT